MNKHGTSCFTFEAENILCFSTCCTNIYCLINIINEKRCGWVGNVLREQIAELELAYAITIHKAQGSEFEAVILPVLTQHFRMLFRNLIYTGLTRARKLAVFVGTRKALAMAVANRDTGLRQTALRELVGREE